MSHLKLYLTVADFYQESPPPEPTPSPPPQPMHRPSLPASLPQQPSMPLPIPRAPLHQDSISQSPMGGNIAPARSPAVGTPLQMGVPNMPSHVPVQPYQAQAVPSPAPYYQPLQARTTPYATPSAHPSTYQSTPAQQPVAAVPSPQPYPQTTAQPSPYTANRYPAPTPAPAPAPAAPVYNPNAPRPIEVFHLSEAANAAIPADVRSEFHCDDRGHVLFFSTPPMDIVSSAAIAKKGLSHSLKYLAAKAEREKQRKRRLEEEQQQEQETMSIDVDQQAPTTKRARLDTEKQTELDPIDPSRLTNLISKTVSLLARDIETGTNTFYNSVYTDAKTAAEYAEADAQQREQDAKTYALAKKVAIELREASVDEFASRPTDLRRKGVYLDDVN